jgi:hypothetical protein
MNPIIDTILEQFKQLNPQDQRQLIAQLISQSPSTPSSENPWLATAGSLTDDPFFDEYIAAIAQYRQSQDQQLESSEQPLNTNSAA